MIDQYQYVSIFVPAGSTFTFDSTNTKAGAAGRGDWNYAVRAYVQSDDGTLGEPVGSRAASAPYYWRNPYLPDTFEVNRPQFEDIPLFTAEVSSNYVIALAVTNKNGINELDRGAATFIQDFGFTDENGFTTKPCALDELFKCQLDGGNVFVSTDYSYESAAIDGVPADLGPGCYTYDHCGTSPFSSIIDQVAVWACDNEQLLNTALGVAVAVAVVAGMIIIGPASAGLAGVVGSGALLGVGCLFGHVIRPTTDSGPPSFDLDPTCVATEIALGAVFAPVGAAAAGARTLRPMLALACGFGAVEGATSTAVHMVFVDEEDVVANDVAVGAVVGCGVGAVLGGLSSAIPRLASDVIPNRAPRFDIDVEPNQAVFWTGVDTVADGVPQGNGADVARAWAATHGGETLENILERKGIDYSNFGDAEWDEVSREMALAASGEVRVLMDYLSVTSTWVRIELPALRANPNVTSVIEINPRTGEAVALW